jgi:hypothetical protein
MPSPSRAACRSASAMARLRWAAPVRGGRTEFRNLTHVAGRCGRMRAAYSRRYDSIPNVLVGINMARKTTASEGRAGELVPLSRGRPLCTRAAPETGLADRWFATSPDPAALAMLGIKIRGGGPHQSKTMMVAEFTDLMAAGAADRPDSAVLRENLLGKPSVRARKAALYRFRQLYGVGESQPICIVPRRLWERDPAGRPDARSALRASPGPGLSGRCGCRPRSPRGERVRWPGIASAFEARHPGRLGEKMAKSLAQNAASSWTRAGFLRGFVRKERTRAHATPACAAYAG